MKNKNEFCHPALTVIETEAKAISALQSKIDHNFAAACEILYACRGRIVVTGMGKSGHIANKIAATLASTGSPAFFLHPGEANHGDIGMVTADDVVLALSHSGEASEILSLIPYFKRFGIPLIALTGNPNSSLAEQADVVIDASIEKEACPMGLAPTTSTTVALVMGDAIAISLLEAKGITSDDFARSHPAGRLGRRLLIRVADLMRKGDELPIVNEDCMLTDALVEITQKKLGMTTVVNKQGQLRGVFTDGDLRRALDNHTELHTLQIKELMTSGCKTIDPNVLATEALKLMEENKITSLVSLDENQRPIGICHLHDILGAGIA